MILEEEFRKAISKVLTYKNVGFVIDREVNIAVSNVMKSHTKFIPTSDNIVVESEQMFLVFHRDISSVFEKINKDGIGYISTSIFQAVVNTTVVHFRTIGKEANADYIIRAYKSYYNNKRFKSPDTRYHIYHAIHNMIQEGIPKVDIVKGFGGNPRPTELMYDAFVELNSSKDKSTTKIVVDKPIKLNLFTRAKLKADIRKK
jgi:hypothetical protein